MRNLIIALAILAGTLTTGYFLGCHITTLKAGLGSTQQLVHAMEQLNAANLRVRDLERAAQSMVLNRAEQLKQEQAHAKHQRDHFVADLSRGTVSVSIPIASHARPASADPATAGSHRQQTRSQLDPTAAATLAAIAGDGDDAIRQLNTCIDTYNAIRAQYNVQTE